MERPRLTRRLCAVVLASAVAAWMAACSDDLTRVGSSVWADVCTRTPQVRDEIVRHAGVPCQAVNSRHLSTIEVIDLGEAGISALKAADFQGLHGLKRLYLSGNSLTALPEGVFGGLEELERLALTKNNLTALPEHAFAGLSSLEWLTLGSNNISALPEAVFAGLSGLQLLDLTSNGITEFPENLFGGLLRLKWVGLTGNRLKSLRPGTFASLGSLEELLLGYNDLDTLPEHLFVDLVGLKRLDLRYNNLAALPEGLFLGPQGLQSLDLGHNRLEVLPERVFHRLTALQSLKLNDNRLIGLPEKVFRDPMALRELKLEGNGLGELPAGLLGNLAGLESLSVADNYLGELPAGFFSGLESLKRLALHGNPGSPFALTLQLERADSDDLLASGPASVVLSVVEGAPFGMLVNISAQGGDISATQAALEAGTTSSSDFEVNSSTGTATHVSAGPPPRLPGEFTGLEIAVSDPIVLFAEASNHSPVAAEAIPPYRLRTGGRAAEVELSLAYFDDPDENPLTFSATSSNTAVATASVADGQVTFAGVAEGSAQITVRATDPGGLFAEQSVEIDVIPAGDPEGFDVDLVVVGDFPQAAMVSLREAVERWREIVAQTDFREMPVLADDDLNCFGTRPGFRVVDIEDLLIVATVTEISPAALAQAGPCRLRDGSFHPYLGVVQFNEARMESLVADGRLFNLALHEIGHILGIGTIWDDLDLLRNPSRNGNAGADTHFAGALAITAFDAAGGTAYAGGAKVPVQNNGRGAADDSHWRTSVMRPELMVAGTQGDAQPLSAITIQALADFGYAVNVSLADPYTMPVAAAAGAESAGDWIDLGNDVFRGPIRIVDEEGRVVRVLRN